MPAFSSILRFAFARAPTVVAAEDVKCLSIASPVYFGLLQCSAFPGSFPELQHDDCCAVGGPRPLPPLHEQAGHRGRSSASNLKRSRPLAASLPRACALQRRQDRGVAMSIGVRPLSPLGRDPQRRLDPRVRLPPRAAGLKRRPELGSLASRYPRPPSSEVRRPVDDTSPSPEKIGVRPSPGRPLRPWS